MSSLGAFLQNKVLLSTLLGWVVAQTVKVFLVTRQKRRFDIRLFLGTGGMPSAHSAGVSALAVAVGCQVGFHTAVFAVALMFALVTMFDAQGVRRATGRQAVALNRIIDDLYLKRPVDPERMKELLGHTPVEVFVGAAVGCGVALLVYRL
jgi:uncharacterized protein